VQPTDAKLTTVEFAAVRDELTTLLERLLGRGEG
jgi:hypothetical protein